MHETDVTLSKMVTQNTFRTLGWLAAKRNPKVIKPESKEL